MKRLIKKAEPITIYHGTNLLSLDNILMSGLAAGKLEDSPWKNTNQNQTFFTTEISNAIFYGETKYINYGSRVKDGIVILEVDFDTRYLEPDNDDAPDAKTWQESDDELNQVAFSGSILSSQVKKIHLYDREKNKIGEYLVEQYLSSKEKIKEKIYKNNRQISETIYKKIEEEILDELYHLKEKIDYCHIVIHKASESGETKDVNKKLDLEYRNIYKIILKTNELIEKHNQEEHDYEEIPKIRTEEKTLDIFSNSEEKTHIVFIHWNGYGACSAPIDVKNSNINHIIFAFKSYFEEKQ